MEPIMYKSLELQRYIILELAIEFGVDLMAERFILMENINDPNDYHIIDTENDETYTKMEIVKLLNEQDYKIHEYKVLAKQLNMREGTLAYLTLLSLDYKDILYIRKDEVDSGTINIYVEDCPDKKQLSKFREHIPLMVKCRFFIVGGERLLVEVDLDG
jgi:hypothetical protein